MKPRTAYLLVIAAACVWGTIGFFVRSLTAAGLTEPVLIAFRSWISAALTFLFLFFYDRRLLRVRLRDLWIFCGTGIISFVFFTLCYFYAIGLTSLSTAAILLYTSPIFVTVLAVLIFKERFTKRKAVCLVMAFTGCVLVSGIGTETVGSPLGIFLGLLSGFLYGLYSIFGEVALRRYQPLTIIAYTFLFASIGILPFCRFETLAEIHWEAVTVLQLIVFSAGSGAVAYLLYTLGLAKVKATNAAIAAIAEPVVAALTGLLVFGESLSAPAITGICLVIFAILLLSAPQKEKKPARVR